MADGVFRSEFLLFGFKTESYGGMYIYLVIMRSGEIYTSVPSSDVVS